MQQINNSKKNILLITHSADIIGGAEEDFYNLLKYLKSVNKYNLIVITPKGPMFENYAAYSYQIHSLPWGVFPVVPINKYLDYLKYLIKALIQIIKIFWFLRNVKVDLCLINVVVLLGPAIVIKLKRIKTIIFVKETIEPADIRYKIYKYYSKFVYAFIPNSQIINNDIKSATNHNNIHTIYSSPTCSNINPSAPEFVYNDKFKLLLVGNIGKKKNQFLLLDALSELIKIDEDYFVYLVGNQYLEKNYYSYLLNFIEKNKLTTHVEFTGIVKKEELLDLYKKVGCLVISSNSEGIPIVLVYALKYKIPIISTKVGGIPEIIKDNENGLLVNNKIDLINAILKLKDKNVYNKLIKNGYNTYKEKFNFDENMKLLSDIIDNALI